MKAFNNILVGSIIVASHSSGVWAQQESRTQLGLEEVLVTAQKRVSSIQDTAIAISAFGGDMLENRGIDDITKLQSYVPGLHIAPSQEGVAISMRGIGLQGFSSITDSGVAFYIDDFYQSRPTGGYAVFYDIDRVEVLRGPQGTLYGRNATGGVINVISKTPAFEREGKIGVTFGSRNQLEVRGMANSALGELFAARISALYSEEDGYIENEGSGQDALGSDGDVMVRGQLLYQGDNDLEALLSVTHNDLKGTGVPYQFLERNPGPIPPVQALLSSATPDSKDPLKIYSDVETYNNAETLFAFLRIKKSFDAVDVYMQLGTLTQDTELRQDLDGSDVDVSIFDKTQENDADSFELRISSNYGDSLEWILGAYYFEEDTSIFRGATAKGVTPGGPLILPEFLLDEEGNSQTVAGFASATYSLTDVFRVSGGLRYTEDEKSGSLTYISNLGLPLPPDLDNVKENFSKVTWKLGLEWDVTDVALGYINISNGYKAGGFNITSSGAPYDEETILAYELGLKSNPLDGKAKLNLDTFYYTYDDLQLTTLTTVNGAPGQLTTNAGEATIYGIELESQYAITDSFLVSLNYAYINAEFEEYFNSDPRDPNLVFNPSDPKGLGREDLTGNKLPFVSENTVTIGLQYGFDIGSGNVIASLDSSWHSDLYLREFNDRIVDRVGPNTKTDFTVTYFADKNGFSITAFGSNLENDVEKTNIFTSAGFIGASANTAYSRPRTYGLKLDYSF